MTNRIPRVVRHVVAVAFLVISCCAVAERTSAAANDEKGNETMWGEAVHGVKCAVAIKERHGNTDEHAPFEFVAIEPIWIQCQTKNVGSETVKVVGTLPIRVYELTIKDPDGKVVPLTQYGQHRSEAAGEASKTVQAFSPSDEDATPILINRLYDMTRSGEYKVSFSRGFVLPDGTIKIATSNVLAITVQDPK